MVDASDDAYLATSLVFRPGLTYNPQITPLNPRFSPTTFIRCDDLLHRFFSFRRAADKRYSLAMPWTHYEFDTHGKPAIALLDTQFAQQAPAAQLPNLAWFAVYHQQPPGGSWWRRSEASKLEAIEQDLIKLCSAFGNGWAVYVRRLQTPGINEYYVYFGNGAELQKVLPSLKAQHGNYRLEFESRPDPEWSQYKAWIKESAGHG